MTIPSVYDIAQEHQLDINPKTLQNKEVMCKCPFCFEDEGKNKYYLSLNPQKNVFKCWYCHSFGGAIQFESMITGQDYNVVYNKYIKSRSQKQHHLAFDLTPDQLREIGWQDLKVKNYASFAKKKDEVLRDWKNYEDEEMTKLYAIYLLIGHYPHDYAMRYQQWFVKKVNESYVSNVTKKLKSEQDENWKRKGKTIARKVYKVTYNHSQPENLFVNVLITLEIAKYKG